MEEIRENRQVVVNNNGTRKKNRLIWLNEMKEMKTDDNLDLSLVFFAETISKLASPRISTSCYLCFM